VEYEDAEEEAEEEDEEEELSLFPASAGRGNNAGVAPMINVPPSDSRSLSLEEHEELPLESSSSD
jgi:hypothetical protein